MPAKSLGTKASPPSHLTIMTQPDYVWVFSKQCLRLTDSHGEFPFLGGRGGELGAPKGAQCSGCGVGHPDLLPRHCHHIPWVTFPRKFSSTSVFINPFKLHPCVWPLLNSRPIDPPLSSEAYRKSERQICYLTMFPWCEEEMF